MHLLPSHLPWNRLLPRCFPKKWWNAFSFQNKVHCSQSSTTNFLVPFLVDTVWKYMERKTDYMANTRMRGTQAWFVVVMMLLMLLLVLLRDLSNTLFPLTNKRLCWLQEINRNVYIIYVQLPQGYLAAISLFRSTNKAGVTSSANDLYNSTGHTHLHYCTSFCVLQTLFNSRSRWMLFYPLPQRKKYTYEAVSHLNSDHKHQNLNLMSNAMSRLITTTRRNPDHRVLHNTTTIPCRSHKVSP